MLCCAPNSGKDDSRVVCCAPEPAAPPQVKISGSQGQSGRFTLTIEKEAGDNLGLTCDDRAARCLLVTDVLDGGPLFEYNQASLPYSKVAAGDWIESVNGSDQPRVMASGLASAGTIVMVVMKSSYVSKLREEAAAKREGAAVDPDPEEVLRNNLAEEDQYVDQRPREVQEETNHEVIEQREPASFQPAEPSEREEPEYVPPPPVPAPQETQKDAKKDALKSLMDSMENDIEELLSPRGSR